VIHLITSKQHYAFNLAWLNAKSKSSRVEKSLSH